MFSLKPKPQEGALPSAKILPFRKRRSVTALDLEGDLLHVAQAAGRAGGARITRLAAIKIDLPADKRESAAALGGAIRAALESAKLHPREAALVLPRAQVVLRPLQVPMVTDVRELASIINFQIAKDLPFRLEDAVVDFKVLRAVEVAAAEGQPPEKRLDVLVGAVRADILDFHRQVAHAAGFKLAALGLRSIASAFCASKCVPAPSEKALLLVSVRTDETTVEVMVDQKLVFSRAAAVPVENHAPLPTLEIEVVRSLHSYEGTSVHRPIEKIVVAGRTGIEPQLRELLAQRLNLPADVLDPDTCLKLDASNGGSVASIGLALSALELGGLPIDFANPKKPAVQRNTKRTQALLAAVAAVAILFTLLGVRMNLVKKRTAIKQEVQAQLLDAEKKVPIYRRLKAQTKAINTWMAEDQNWLDHIAYLSAILPPADQLYVSTFSTTPQHLLRFSVQAKTGELLAELDKKLRAAGYEVRPLSITPASDKHGYSFRTTVELSIPRKMKPDLAKVKPPPRPPDDHSLNLARK